jgi:hypothetical protein
MNSELATVNAPVGSLIGPVMDVAMARERLMQFQQFVKEYLVENEDFGVIPGTPKPTLLKPGADKLCELYGLADDYEVTQRTEDFEKGLFDYEVKCVLMSKGGGFLVSTGLGSCNSYEKKYRWRDAQRLCPNCGKDSIIKGKAEYGGGWLCFAKKGGCGAKFPEADPGIVNQTVGKVHNDDVADLKNTILKMAKKRAKVDATLSATRSSGLFTQDTEDWDIPKASVAAPQNSSAPLVSAIIAQPATASAAPPPVQPSTQPPAAPQTASHGRVGPTKRIPPTPPENVPGLICTVKSVEERPKKGNVNASIRVMLDSALDGKNQGVTWVCGWLTCWHAHLFDAVRQSVGKECQFHIKEQDVKTKTTDEWPTHYVGIEDVVYVDGVEFQEGKLIMEGAK